MQIVLKLTRLSMLNKLFLLSLILSACSERKPVESNSVVTEPPVFKRVLSSHSGVTFANIVDENINNYFDLFAYVYNGGGVGIGDINNDGLSDLYFTGNEIPNKLYLNQGNLKFKDITESAGVAGNGKWNNGITMIDINEDGLLDIYVCKGGYHDNVEQRKNLLFINQGDLTFKEQAKEFGLDESGYSIHASFFDMDNDNDLDLYVTNRPDSFDLSLTEMVRQKKLSPAISRDKLFLNEEGKFRDIGIKAGIVNNFGYALSVVTSDLNNDGFIDIFVANDFAEGDYMYINQKNGTFKEKIKEATNHISMYSMGTDIADINNDGMEDIFVSEMLPEDYKRSKVSMPSMDSEGFYAIVNGGMHKQYMHNALHLNQGNLFFSEISQMAGVAKTEWSWSCLLSDFDNDGQRDIFVANGYKRDVFDGDAEKKLAAFVRANMNKYASPNEMLVKGFKEFINVYDPIKVKNYLFKNKGDLQFENVSDTWGFEETSFSNGAAVGDLDNDGDLDLIVNNLDDEAFIYENTAEGRNNYFKVKLIGPKGNADGLGAKVTLYYDGKLQYFENKTVRGYLSSNEPVIHFGLGKNSVVDSIKVVWNDGLTSLLKETEVNQTIQVRYSEALRKKTSPEVPKLFRESTSDLLSDSFLHRENEVNEYKDQLLIPHMFSRSGPFISSGDINKDGEDDFYIGGAAGQAGILYLQRNGKMLKISTPAFDQDKNFEDMGSSLFDVDNDGDIDLYVVSGGSEFPEGSPQYVDRVYLNDGKGNFTKADLINTKSSGSCVVPYDIDGDGDLDLFRGGQVVAGNYPKSPKNYILINNRGKFVDQTDKVAPGLSEVGMVTSALWVDLNGDKKSELVVVGEWMPIKIYESRQGKLINVSDEYGVENTEGWWNRVVADDLDGDGDLDLIVGNLGENYKFKASHEKPFQVFAKDFDNNGTNDIFLARYYHDTLLVPIRGRECTSQQLPKIAQKFPTYLSFASSDLPTILGSDIENAIHYKAHLFSSVILINEKGKFVIKKLPAEAQLSAINGIIVHDFDNDGVKDILLGGNKFDVEVETTPADASPGLLLKGMGDLNFSCLKPYESGFFVPYNVKDVQMIKVDNKWTVLVSVNNERLRTFSVTNPGVKSGLALVK
ncbi:MAG: VCBS repeat-containing protein [Bacteroidia bacterium]|nr:VCBS repeat-containing protein [Bacteroidia bacterium]